MTTRRWQRVKELFNAVRELPRAQRSVYLASHCSDDVELCAEVESLLEHDESHPLMRGVTRRNGSGEGPAETAAPPFLPCGTQIGRYRVLDVIGEGGMGVVYRAEQDNPRRAVALKLIRPGSLSPSMLRRFEHESHVLGLLHHPGIAQVYDAGTADTGHGPQPFFAMELVEGEPILQFAEARGLGTRERLRLLVKICSAVEHAHQKGVIHRDLTPANILVEESDSGWQPKILDFGVARSTDADTRTTTLHTSAGELLGTVPYMSPEQCEGDPRALDTRTDVHGLGVMAFEMLTGRLPYSLDGKSLYEAVRTIAEAEPQLLSAVDPGLRGDLTAIIAKALEKDRDRRYASASTLAADIDRHLRNEPIEARSTSGWYLLGKTVRRYKVTVTIAASFVILITVFLFLSLHFYFDAADEAAKSKTTSELLSDTLAFITPELARGRDTTILREMLFHLEQRVETVDQLEVEAEIREMIGRVYRVIGEGPRAREHFRRALEIRDRILELGDNDRETLATMGDLGWSLLHPSMYDEGEGYLRRALEGRRKLLGDSHEDTLDSMTRLGIALERRRTLGESESLHREALGIRRDKLGPEHPDTLWSMAHLADTLHGRGEYEEAERLARQALAHQRRILGEAHEHSLFTLHVLGLIVRAQGRFEEAESTFRAALSGRAALLGPDAPNALNTKHHLALTLAAQGGYAQAARLHEEILPVKRRTMHGREWETARTLHALAEVRESQGELSEAERHYREALEIAVTVHSETDWLLHLYRLSFGRCLLRSGMLTESELLLTAARDGLQQTRGPDDELTLQAADHLAELQRDSDH